MEQIIRYILKISVFALSFWGLAVISRNYLRKKKGEAELMDSEVVFPAGIGAALITMALTKGIQYILAG